ncbi:AAA family ATPase [Heyndrickxia oleronia]|uniref:AAA family ATPase n=1 Tax=Heyndrickxia oleronia TaxID=38875 RepID=UPI00203ABD71|nr:AAA family ATPase [Heyndrickxia oleronia]
MQINFIELKLLNFKSHRDLTVNFGEVTKITGDNAKGKSTIPESTSWLLYGTDALGSKLDPTPITYESEETLVSLFLKVDEKSLLLGRGLKKGKTHYYINEVPSKAGEFNEIVEQLFDKELFFSLYNPNYFFTLHWEKQRAMLLQYVTAPANKEVLNHMLDEHKKCLEPLLKKHSLDAIEAIQKENKKKMDKQYIAAQSRTKTLKEQLDEMAPNTPLESLKSELSQLLRKRDEIEKSLESADDNNRNITIIENEIDFLIEKKKRLKEQAKAIRAEVIIEVCSSCGQSLNEESKEKIKNEQDARVERLKPEFNEAHTKLKTLKTQLAQLNYIEITEQHYEYKLIQEKINPIEREIANYKNYERMQKQVEQATAEEKEVLSSLNESIFILDTIKAFRAKEAELQAEKVQALFETLSIRLFEKQKNGELKNTFEIEMDGKPYRKLSLSEGIRAGLELREVLSKQSEVIAPVLVDNAESITRFKQPTGQLIISRVVAGEELKIERVDA